MSEMSDENRYDVIVLCALRKEAKAFIDIVSQQCNVSFAYGGGNQGRIMSVKVEVGGVEIFRT
jgi:hypothetical protein